MVIDPPVRLPPVLLLNRKALIGEVDCTNRVAIAVVWFSMIFDTPFRPDCGILTMLDLARAELAVPDLAPLI
ncbi:hypothetical protein [Mesorhizobium silamurunense]|uniref:hypothetical protein n=1 Tax=Mesorhizobium silamurunense TaxID=499528 RepID=UPI0017810487|nr:hypothetical protein [Mesorhizobium silamurunense]